MKRNGILKKVAAVVATCCFISIGLQFFNLEPAKEAVQMEFINHPYLAFWNDTIISGAKPPSPETNCIPKELQYLTTKYSAKLCHPHYLWPKENSSLNQLTCKYPALNPFDNVITEFMGQSVKRNLCVKDSTLPKMFSTDYASNLLTLQSPETFGFFNCCYRVLTPSKDSDFSAARPSKMCFPIGSISQRIRDEFIKIVCYGNNSDANGTVQNETVVDFQAFVPPELKIQNIIPSLDIQYTFNLDTQLNIAILGLDAVSHMNLIRTMPKSYEYIQETLNAFGFFGYNSIGDNTFDNMMPVLTGYDSKTLTTEKAFKCPQRGPFDNCPFIWKEFSSRGYQTIFGEDASFLGTFHYSKMGFEKHPTDFYLRPFLQAADDVFRPGHDDFPCFAGPRLYFEYLLDYMKSLAVNLGRSNRYFQLLWESPLCHSFLNRPVAGDDIFLEALTWFKQNNYLNNTVLILMSDHGMRYEGIRETLQGKVEVQMPFLFFILPEWFQKKYPKSTLNMRDNKYKLVTAFDIHWTLRDLLTMQFENEDQSNRNSLGFGQSLFRTLSNSRECKNAGIPEEFCSCRNYEITSTNSSRITEVARYVVAQVNEKLQNYPQCEKLTEENVLSAYVIPNFQIKTDNYNLSRKVEDEFENAFMISLKTIPGNAIFEAEVGVKSQDEFKLLGKVKRINKYNNQSHCVQLYDLKSYCFCKD
ncbi:unnamed protein product [Allacma fusca]|uniref:DUF229 domain containing protein n=1 Tax=Allacma fusca TaxID=39272 RepID=A0A8J2LRS9_9HEXA|nr:unnamed protein product [Allacma fusca]